MSDFWDLILDAALDALIDTAKMLPFLFAVYLLIEYLEHKASDKFAGALRRLGPFGPVGGAVLGCIPQCGFFRCCFKPLFGKACEPRNALGGVYCHER